MIEDQEPAPAGVEPAALEGPAASDEAARKRAREFDHAIFAGLDCRAQSDQARALVDEVMLLVTEAEAAAGKRTNKRDKKQADLRIGVEGFLADLLRARASAEKTHGYVYRPMRPASFTEGNIGYRVFKVLADIMVNLKLVDSYGIRARTKGLPDGPLPYMRFRATERLMALCGSHGIIAADVHKHFLLPLPEHPLQLRAGSSTNAIGGKIKGDFISYERTDETERVEGLLKQLNTFLDGFKLSGGVHRGYVRIFNNGDDPAFKWNMGGRLYSQGEGSYQQMSREERLKMRFAWDALCEIDIRASYLTILYAWCGEQLDPKRDPYDIPGLGPERRDLVKRWVAASFGNNAPITKWPKDVRKDFEEAGRTLSKQDSARKIGAKVLAAHPVLDRLGETIGAHQVGWAELMYVESRAMLRTMLDLMDDKVPSLSVHDSVIVPELKVYEALVALRRRYREFTGANPVLVIHPRPGERLLLPTGVDPVYNIIAAEH